MASSKSDSDTIEKAFDWLHKAKDFSKQQESWKAADAYLQGRGILERLAEAQPQSTVEEQQIHDLYQQKAREYLHEARKCLIAAMTKENEADEQNNKASGDKPPYFKTMTNEEAEMRIKTFYSLFSKPMELPEESTEANNEKSTSDQQWSLEERLMELNSSLPKGFKTSDERMDDINRGLNRLGLSLYTQKEPFSRFKDEIPKDDDEQVEDIIAQATEEAEFDKQHGPMVVSKGMKKSNESNNFDDLSSSDDDSDGDDDLDDEILAMKRIQKQSTKALLKLGEVVGALDDAKELKRKMEEEEGLHDDDSKSVIDNEEAIKTMLQETKLKLRKSQKALAKAMAEWTDNNLP
jgi:hypothetical protein